MPHNQITMLAGRTPDQKRKVAERITETIVQEMGTQPDNVTIAFVEVATTDFAKAGVLNSDKKK